MIGYGKNSNLEFKNKSNSKQRAEDVLTRLGIPMSTAIDIYLNQISLTGGIPFAVTLPNAPSVLNADGNQYAIGEKGHGTKIYLRSDKVLVQTNDGIKWKI